MTFFIHRETDKIFVDSHKAYSGPGGGISKVTVEDLFKNETTVHDPNTFDKLEDFWVKSRKLTEKNFVGAWWINFLPISVLSLERFFINSLFDTVFLRELDMIWERTF